jgi:hypothetical protein
MSSSNYQRPRRKRAPKPLSVPACGAAIGLLLFILGLGPLNTIDLASLGLIFFFWGLISFSVLLITRRRARRSHPVL